MKSNIEDSDAILIVQYSQLSDVADLRRDGSIELIRGEEAEKATMKKIQWQLNPAHPRSYC